MRPYFGRRARVTVLAALAALVLSVGTAAGQEQEQERILRAIRQLEERLTRLEQAQKATSATGSPNQPPPDVDELGELRRQLAVLAQEVEKLRSGDEEVEIDANKTLSLGLGSSAAAVYRKRHGVSIAGYGEMTFENFAARNEEDKEIRSPSQFDFLRAILYTGYRFSDKFLFNSEIEFEHATTGKSGEASVEFAYLDYLANEHVTLRGGLLLIPMGLTNEFHEPNAFFGVRRSETESRIIPTTWRENGFGMLGSYGRFQYRAYVVNGLDAHGFSSDGLRGGRQKGSKAKATDMAFVGRLDFAPTTGTFIGGSFYVGGSDHGQFVVSGQQANVTTTIGEIHGQLQMRGVDVRGLFARAVLGDVEKLNTARGLAGSSSVGETLQGGYLQFGYNVLSQFKEGIRLTPYYRFEKLNTQADVPAGFAADPSRDRTFYTLGLEFQPLHGIVLKSDYQWSRNRARKGLNQWNLGIGYAF